ncbi:MAG: hypothetical protein ACD_47C00406G0001 [uncultured bacterium]|nr:MAG: hypothetical protein ACD_47C00406G0001 [uncultured bacterium]
MVKGSFSPSILTFLATTFIVPPPGMAWMEFMTRFDTTWFIWLTSISADASLSLISNSHFTFEPRAMKLIEFLSSSPMSASFLFAVLPFAKVNSCTVSPLA